MTKFKAIFGLDNDDRLEAVRWKLDMWDLCEHLGVEELEDRGREICGLCPWHDDSKPSWSINADADSDRWGLHSCWVCRDNADGLGRGNVVTLVRDLKHLHSYGEALGWLERWVGIDTSSEARLDLPLDQRIRAHTVRQADLDPQGAPGRRFKTMTPLKPGSAGWRYLTGRGVTPDQIQERGVRVGRKKYSGRVVFPVWSRGRVSTFYARAITEDRSPKGLYPKGKNTIKTVLFGLERADLSVDTCYLVEGVFDVLAIERALKLLGKPGASNVFATLGPILHESQAALLKHFNRVVIVPDMKGKALSIVPTCKQWLTDKVLHTVQVDRGHDPDSVARKLSLERLANYLEDPPLTRDKRVILKVDYGIYR